MTRTRTPVAMIRACTYLQTLIDSPATRAKGLLPPICIMARTAGVCRSTMCTALRHLKHNGVVVSVHGRILLACGKKSTPSPPFSPRTIPPVLNRIEHLAAALCNELHLNDQVPGTALAPSKHLCAHFKASFPSIRQALALLEQSELIERNGRGFRTRTLPPRLARSTLVLVTSIDSPELISSWTPWARVFWHEIEAGCHRHNLSLSMLSIDDCVSRNSLLPPGQRNRPVVGYLAHLLGIHHNHREILLSLLTSSQLPAALFSDTTSQPPPLRTPLMRWYCACTTEAGGRALGRYLRTHGYRRVAWFAPAPDDPVVHARLEGVRTAFDEAGLHDSIRTYSPDPLAEPTRCTLSRFLENIEDRITSKLPPWAGDAITAGLHDTTLGFRSSAQRHVEALECCQRLRPCFAAALAHGWADVWVGYNDTTALVARDYLREHHIADMAIAGFDDSLDALRHNLTSVNFNIAAVVRGMLRYILEPHNTAIRAAGPCEPSPFVAERASTSIDPARNLLLTR